MFKIDYIAQNWMLVEHIATMIVITLKRRFNFIKISSFHYFFLQGADMICFPKISSMVPRNWRWYPKLWSKWLLGHFLDPQNDEI